MIGLDLSALKVYLAVVPCDMRKGFNGLTIAATSRMMSKKINFSFYACAKTRVAAALVAGFLALGVYGAPQVTGADATGKYARQLTAEKGRDGGVASHGSGWITFSPHPGAFALQEAQSPTSIYLEPGVEPVLHTAVRLFADDVGRVTGIPLTLLDALPANPGRLILVGVKGNGKLVDKLAGEGRLDLSSMTDGEMGIARVMDIAGKGPALVIAGSDARGAAYVLMEISRQMGVSPWYWWADVPVTRRPSVYVKSELPLHGPPSVRYRGLFLNDEIWSLHPWARLTYEVDPPTIGPKTYARIFELLLRLKANYIWPAMHQNAPVADKTRPFYYTQGNKEVARKYGIIVGTSHIEPLHRNTMGEWEGYGGKQGSWKSWVPPDGSRRGPWEYSKNADQIKTYWSQRVAEVADYENVFTVGMRGVGDSGMTGGQSTAERARTLESIIADQRDILSKYIKRPVEQIPQIFVPYKEALDLFNTGMRIPADITLVWPDDNHGYIRQLPDPEQRKRSGSSGIYYHLSYWGHPEDYLWLSTISPSLIAREMNRARAFGADRLWVFNSRGIKPLEKEVGFAMDMAWDVRMGTMEHARDAIHRFAGETFGKDWADPVASLYHTFYRLTQRAKPEHVHLVSHMHLDKLNARKARKFTESEARDRLADWEKLKTEEAALQKRLPTAYHAAWFQLVGYPIRAAALMEEKHTRIWWRRLASSRGDMGTAEKEAALAVAAHKGIEELTRVYNEDIAGGKWRHMMAMTPRNRPQFQMPDNFAAVNETVSLPLPDPIASFKATDFVLSGNTELASIATIPWIDSALVSVAPITAPSISFADALLAPWVEYKVARDTRTGTVDLEIVTLPVHSAYAGRGVRIAVSLNGSEPLHFNLNREPYHPEWNSSVLSGRVLTRIPVPEGMRFPMDVRIYLLDPCVALKEVRLVER